MLIQDFSALYEPLSEVFYLFLFFPSVLTLQLTNVILRKILAYISAFLARKILKPIQQTVSCLQN